MKDRHEQPMGQFSLVGKHLYEDEFVLDGTVYCVGTWRATL